MAELFLQTGGGEIPNSVNPEPQNHPENGLLQRPLDMQMIADIVNSADPLAAIREISSPYPYEQFLAKINGLKFKACIDDRRRIGRVSSHSKGNITIFGKPYSFEPKSDEYLTGRELLGSRPLPGGRFGIDILTMVESMATGDMQKQAFWYQDGHDFVQNAVGYVIGKSNNICSIRAKDPLPIHIDNGHGTIPTWIGSTTNGQPHYQNLEELLNAKKGCGAHANYLAIVASVLQVMGNSQEAQELLTKMGGDFIDGIPQVPGQVAASASDMLYQNAIDKDSPVDIMVGPHNPTGVVLTLGQRSVNRRCAQISLGDVNFFKADLAVGHDPESTMHILGKRVHEEFGGQFNADRLVQTAVATNLVTLLQLGQAGIPRYYVD